MNLVKGLTVVVSMSLLCAAGAVSAGTIDFEDLNQDAELEGVGDMYWSQGYTFHYAPTPGEPYPVGFSSVGPSWPYNTSGSIALTANSVMATTTLKRDDAQPFALLSIDLAETNGPDSRAGTKVVFHGTTAIGLEVTQEFNLDDQVGFERFFFSENFRNLISVSWRQGDFNSSNVHMFDNVVIETMRPEGPSRSECRQMKKLLAKMCHKKAPHSTGPAKANDFSRPGL